MDTESMYDCISSVDAQVPHAVKHMPCSWLSYHHNSAFSFLDMQIVADKVHKITYENTLTRDENTHFYHWPYQGLVDLKFSYGATKPGYW